MSNLHRITPFCARDRLFLHAGMPTLSEAALKLLRDDAIIISLRDYFSGSTAVSLDDCGGAYEYVKNLFDAAELEVPSTYMANVARFYDRVHQIRTDVKGKIKKDAAEASELIKFAFELCNVNTADGLLAAIAEAKGRPVPGYYVPKGVSNRKLNAAKEELDQSESKRAEERKRSDAQIAELNLKVAELTSTIKEMKAKRDGAMKLGMYVISGTWPTAAALPVALGRGPGAAY